MKSFGQSIAVLIMLIAISVGCSSAQLRVDAIGFTQRDIYHSPETPGYTAWVGLWQMPNGNLRCDFIQVTGPKDNPVSTAPVLESKDDGATWTRLNPNSPTKPEKIKNGYFSFEPMSCRGAVVLSDGTMVRPVWPPNDVNDSGGIQRSTDGGKTWGDKIYFLPVKDYRTWPAVIKVLRDGRLVLFAGCWKRGDARVTGGEAWWQNMEKTMFVSKDNGKTWSKPITILPITEGSCEESDFCELPNGDLFFIHRVQHFPDHKTDRLSSPLVAVMGANPPQSYWYSDRMQSIVRKSGDTFIPGKCEPAPFPHSGFPMVMYTKEGLILHLATNDASWTADEGKTWNKLSIPGMPYYPKALRLKDGTIIIIGHRGSDNAYGSVDQAIVQQTFKLRVSDGDAPVTLGPELVTNGTFETGAVGWEYNSAAQTTADTATFHSGPKSLKIYNSAGAAEAVIAQTVNAQAGKTYRTDFWYKGSSLYFKLLPSNGTGTGVADMLPGAADWTHFTKDWISSEGTATKYSLQLFPFDAGSSVWMDDFSIKEVLPAN